jgi:pSer/pThr/pTyr-binding forkhead associated (FHA) protein
MRKLNVSSPGGATTSFELAEAVITIGRGPDNLVHLEDSSVSGRHAQITVSGDIYELRDLDSTNGTRVNGTSVTTATLQPGDRIKFGKVEACFECQVLPAEHPLPILAKVEAQPAEVSTRPADFANASPFPKRTTESDPVRLALFAAAAVAILAFLGSMVALMQMQPPAF